MKIIKSIGDSMKEQGQTEIAKETKSSYMLVHNLMCDLERKGLVIRYQKGNETIVNLTARGRLLWKTLSDIEDQLGVRIGG
jgi:predicted transcriptional regulator